MKKKTKIIIIAVVAVALVALAVWYFGFHKKKAKETDESEKTGNIGLSTVDSDGSTVRRASIPDTVIDVIQRPDYNEAPAAAYRLNNDQIESSLGNVTAGAVQKISQTATLINTNKTRR